MQPLHGPHIRIVTPSPGDNYTDSTDTHRVYFMFPGQEKTIRVKIDGKFFNKTVKYDASEKGRGITWTAARDAEAFIINGNRINKKNASFASPGLKNAPPSWSSSLCNVLGTCKDICLLGFGPR
jgi:hypothetical protein